MLNASLFSSAKGDWETPVALFERYRAIYNIQFDVCATAENTKCEDFFSPHDNALLRPWPKCWKWMNPPYGRGIGTWIMLAAEARNTVCLLPSRTDTKWWHQHIWDNIHHCPRPATRVEFLPGRLRFQGAVSSAPFPSAIVIFR
jgi:phage N-6-adenine-methyltransferase